MSSAAAKKKKKNVKVKELEKSEAKIKGRKENEPAVDEVYESMTASNFSSS